jgi:hypothetical protein
MLFKIFKFILLVSILLTSNSKGFCYQIQLIEINITAPSEFVKIFYRKKDQKEKLSFKNITVQIDNSTYRNATISSLGDSDIKDSEKKHMYITLPRAFKGIMQFGAISGPEDPTSLNYITSMFILNKLGLNYLFFSPAILTVNGKKMGLITLVEHPHTNEQDNRQTATLRIKKQAQGFEIKSNSFTKKIKKNISFDLLLLNLRNDIAFLKLMAINKLLRNNDIEDELFIQLEYMNSHGFFVPKKYHIWDLEDTFSGEDFNFYESLGILSNPLVNNKKFDDVLYDIALKLDHIKISNIFNEIRSILKLEDGSDEINKREKILQNEIRQILNSNSNKTKLMPDDLVVPNIIQLKIHEPKYKLQNIPKLGTTVIKTDFKNSSDWLIQYSGHSSLERYRNAPDMLFPPIVLTRKHNSKWERYIVKPLFPQNIVELKMDPEQIFLAEKIAFKFLGHFSKETIIPNYALVSTKDGVTSLSIIKENFTISAKERVSSSPEIYSIPLNKINMDLFADLFFPLLAILPTDSLFHLSNIQKKKINSNISFVPIDLDQSFKACHLINFFYKNPSSLIRSSYLLSYLDYEFESKQDQFPPLYEIVKISKMSDFKRLSQNKENFKKNLDENFKLLQDIASQEYTFFKHEICTRVIPKDNLKCDEQYLAQEQKRITDNIGCARILIDELLRMWR